MTRQVLAAIFLVAFGLSACGEKTEESISVKGELPFQGKLVINR